MHLLPRTFRLTTDGVEIDGPHGSVLLRLRVGQIEAHYTDNKLVNGNAQAYANSLLNAALLATKTFPLPWTYDSQGRQRITDHKQFYEQTFNPELRGIETLKRWARSHNRH